MMQMISIGFLQDCYRIPTVMIMIVCVGFLQDFYSDDDNEYDDDDDDFYMISV